MLETIKYAAVKLPNDIIVYVERPWRHMYLIEYEGIEGFITSEGRFVDRREAKEIARKYMTEFPYGHTDLPELYTEDLW